MTTAIFAGLITLLFTTALTIAGLGAAFILIPVFIGLGIDIHVAMSTALLLNSIAMVFASRRFIKAKLVLWELAIPIIVVGIPLSALGALASQHLDRVTLLWAFVAFLLFAAAMMLFYRPSERERAQSRRRQLAYGVGVGAFAGFFGGLIGVGGGNFIIPVLVWLGVNPKRASGTTSFIIIFLSFAGFLGHVGAGGVSPELLAFTGVGSALGAVIGAWLMTDKLNRRQVKLVIGVVLLVVATKIAIGLV